MALGYIDLPERGANDRFLGHLAERLLEAGWRVAGAVQESGAADARGRCDMDLRLLPSGPVIRISQCLGLLATGCRLDPGALEQAVAACAAALPGAEALIVNKFGKHEAEGRGFRTLIAEALAQELPVVVGVGDLNRAAFLAFAGELAEPLPADVDAILAWLAAPRARVAP